MKNEVHATTSIQYALIIPHIPYVKFQLRTGIALAHVILLFLVAAENTNFSDVGI
ncbi:hypothetical protein D3C71_1742540 [compost metagenome]